MKIFLSINLIICIAQIGISQQHKLPPRDETNTDPSLAAFVEDLKKAINTKDEEWIYSKLDNNVISTYGDEEGIETFKIYSSPQIDSTDFWPYLTRAVSLGGVFLHDTADETGRFQFVFPYTYDADMEMEDDFYMMGAITGKNVNLRSAPTVKSDVITQLSYDIIFLIPLEEEEYTSIGTNAQGDPEWYHLTTYDKKYKGWVNWQYISTLFGPRLFLFKDKKDKWKISAFVAGD